jgi:hypothetical protein
MKQQALAGKARSITGTAPLYMARIPSVFIKCLKTSRTPLNCPSVAKKKCFVLILILINK